MSPVEVQEATQTESIPCENRPEKTFNLKGQEVSLDEYREGVFQSLKKNGNTSIHPEAILGFVNGSHVDFKEYDKVGFHHPKEKSYYDLAKEDEKFIEILEGIRFSESIEDPITIYLHEVNENTRHIVCVDGATRLSCIGYLRKDNPDIFKRVAVSVFRGSIEEAKASMVRRNLENRTRPLTSYEKMQAVVRFSKSGWTNEEIAERLGQNPDTYAPSIHAIIQTGRGLITPLKNAFRNGKMTMHAATQSAKLSQDEQGKIADKVEQGEKVTGKEVSKKNTTTNIRILPKLANFTADMESFEKHLKKKGWLDDETLEKSFNDTWNGLQDLYDRLAEKEKIEKKSQESEAIQLKETEKEEKRLVKEKTKAEKQAKRDQEKAEKKADREKIKAEKKAAKQREREVLQAAGQTVT